MCIQCEPENDHSCCRLSADLIEYPADQQHLTIPSLRAHKVAHHLYAVWKEDDAGSARCIGTALVDEHRYAWALAQGMKDEGLVLQ